METLGAPAEQRDVRNRKRVCSIQELEIDFTRGVDQDELPRVSLQVGMAAPLSP
jgi:hypothetical protein